MLRDARGIPIHYDDSASATRPDKFESDSIANVSTVAQDGSAGATPTKEKTLPLTESETHLVENDETVPPTSSPTHTSIENPVPVPINLTARTHPLAGDGTQWKGVPLDESYQSDVVDHALEVGFTYTRYVFYLTDY
ncbi:hypothetical protein BDP27DRAFT_23082 [Rhodocollybia butyracea]|uniref:Uncharacterized protein n=1 Tax=Rhodocollybia butyracea TaxID=206335 RepID=A0A9P5UH59_9AGAR|nr:hypothetical protein BDP27DRAFT_23082 [Rhodocollybia butyracea]